jgi:hypothetical protein
MKVFVGVFLLLSSFCLGQFFEENEEFFNSYFDSETQFFQYDESVKYSEVLVYRENIHTDYEADGGPGNPNPEVPINKHYYLLIISALISGTYYLRLKSKSS